MGHIEEDIKTAETELDDDAESIITSERYVYIAQIIKGCYKKKSAGQLSVSDKIDRVVTNRWLGLPIFALVMFLVYYIAMVTVGAAATDWANVDCSETAGICSASAPRNMKKLLKNTPTLPRPSVRLWTWIPRRKILTPLRLWKRSSPSPRPKLPARLKWKMKKPWPSTNIDGLLL